MQHMLLHAGVSTHALVAGDHAFYCAENGARRVPTVNIQEFGSGFGFGVDMKLNVRKQHQFAV